MAKIEDRNRYNAGRGEHLPHNSDIPERRKRECLQQTSEPPSEAHTLRVALYRFLDVVNQGHSIRVQAQPFKEKTEVAQRHFKIVIIHWNYLTRDIQTKCFCGIHRHRGSDR